MEANTPANHLRQQNIPEKPLVKIVYGPNFITAFWKQPPFSEKCDVAFGTDRDHLKALGETKAGLWQFPYVELDPAKEYYVRVQAKNKAGLGPWSDLKTLRVPAPDTAPPVDNKGKPASVATPNWFVQNWGKIWKPALLLMTIGLWMIIIGLILAAYVVIHNNHIAKEMLPAPSQKLVSNEEQVSSIARPATKDEVAKLVTKEELVGITASLAAIDEQVAKLAVKEEASKLATKEEIARLTATAQRPTPATNVVVIGNNNVVNSVITIKRPQPTLTRLTESTPMTEFTETRVVINPCYQTYVPPREYNYSRPIVIPQPQVIYQQPQVIYQQPQVVYQQSQPIGMTVRVTRQPVGQEWYR